MSDTQAPLRTSLLLTGSLIVALSQWILQSLPLDQRSKVIWLSAFGILLFLMPLIEIIRNNENAARLETVIRRIAAWLRLADWQVAVLFASPFLSYMAFVAAGDGSLMRNPAAAILAWILAIGAAILGSLSWPIQISGWRGRAIYLPLALTVAAFFVRAFASDRIPIILTGDEGSSGLAALGFIHGGINNPFITSGFSFPALYYFIESLSIRLFGETTQALRLPSALAGALTVTATYVAGRILFNRRSALIAAIFLAAYSYHINFSRIGLNNIWDGLWYTVVIGALWYGWEQEAPRAFTIAGLCLGIAQYFYPSGRILIVPIVLWFLLMAWVNRERFKRILPYLALMFLVAVVVVLPLGIFYILHPNEFFAPFNRVTLFGPILNSMIKSSDQPVWFILLLQVVKGLGAFTYIPLNAWYLPGTPLLLPLPASLFLLGLVILLIRNSKERFPLLALWIMTFGLIGGLSESTPAAQRYLAAAPVCALLVGYGLDETTGLLERLWPNLKRPLNAIAIAIVIWMTVYELYFYFLVYTPKTVMDWSHTPGVIAQRLADDLIGKPSDLEVVFFGQPLMGYDSIPSIQYLAPDIQGIDATMPWVPQSLPALQARDRLLFVFLPGNESAIGPVQASYPGGQLDQRAASDGTPLYWYYEYRAP
ncbi:MAG TPA: glycosyltransferase family 39 protein [Anaerolineales bacterium]|nr:glycosyltransferase family 39 protein [Anaerolineales bacterium]